MALSSMKMNLDYIRTFTVLGQSRNMTEASHKLHVDTSYVSRHIKQLEQELQTKLILINSKSKEIQFTNAGKYFFEKYEKIYNEILLAEKNFRQMLELDNCKITLGVSQELENIFVKSKLKIFFDTYPHISLKMINGDFTRLVKLLTQYTVDFIVCEFYQDTLLNYESAVIQKIATSSYCFVYNPQKYQFSDLSEASIILPVNNTKEREVINTYFQEKGLSFKRTYEVETFDRMLSYILDGFGVGIVLKDSIQEFDYLQTIDMDLPVDICLCYLKDKVTPSSLELLKLFQD